MTLSSDIKSTNLDSEHSEPPKQELSPGVMAGGRYRVMRLIGRGSMGGVYLAQDTLIAGELVALKVFSRGAFPGEDGLERFVREAQIGRRVAHPQVCRIFDLQADEEIVFVSMEYVAGQSLTYRIKQGALSAQSAINILKQIVEGLAAIHFKGIIHRDIKPSNILLGSGDQVKIIDFGLARMARSEVTVTNALMGTALYLAPELWDGADPSFSSDMYALGVLAYSMITGSPPWRDESVAELMRAHLEKEPVAPSEIVTVSEELDELIMRLLDKEPSNRPLCDDPIFVDVLGVSIGSVRHSGAFHQVEDESEARPPSPLAASPLALSRVMEPASGVFQQLGQEQSALAALLLGSVVCAAAITSGWVLREVHRLFGSSLDSPMTIVGGYAIVVCTIFLMAPALSRGAFRLGLHSNERAVRDVLQRSLRSIALFLLIAFFIPLAFNTLAFSASGSSVSFGQQVVSSILAVSLVFPQIVGLFPIQWGVSSVIVGDTLVWTISSPTSLYYLLIANGFLVYWFYLLSGLLRPPRRRVTFVESQGRLKITAQFVALLSVESGIIVVLGALEGISILVFEQTIMSFSPIQWICCLVNCTFVFWANLRMK
jgi:predicted Ser/Thr protein kinase